MCACAVICTLKPHPHHTPLTPTPFPSQPPLPRSPGLVFPTFASSKPDMVAAGVVPIDRLVDVRACVEVVAARVGREQWRWVYNARVAVSGGGHV